MKLFGSMKTMVSRFAKLPLAAKIFCMVLAAAIVWFVIPKTGSKNAAETYQTATAEKGTLVSFVSSSGTVTSGNNNTITTNATGTVSTVYVKIGDTVTQGAKIADITLDQDSRQKQAAAWASYLSAKNQLASSQAKINSLQSAAFKANQKFMTDAVDRELVTNDPVYIEENAEWLQAEADYKNQASVIEQAQAALTSSWLSYQQISGTITAPTSGVISNLNIAPGSVITSSSNSSSSSSNGTPQQVGTVAKTEGHTQAIVNLSEVDAVKVNTGAKATITMDAFPGKTFTGKVVMINTNGSVSSGVTTYPATVEFDISEGNIYPNMAVSAKIITNVENDAVLVPSAAVTTATDGTSTVRIMKNGKPVVTDVVTGDSDDTQTVIKSGVSEGDTVVTGTAKTGSSSTKTGGSSVFGGMGGNTRMMVR